jgi:hypothetical protein
VPPVAVAVGVAVLVAVGVAVRVAVGVGVADETATFTSEDPDAMPFATTTKVLAPSSIPTGTSNLVETGVLPVATAMVLWS